MTAVLALLAGLLSATVPVLFAAPTSAATGDPFDDSAPTVFIAQAQPTQLYRAVTVGNGSFSFDREGSTTAGVVYNAISFNPADNYIYGMTTSGAAYPAGSLVRIGQGGSVTRVGTTVYEHSDGSTRFYLGAFNPADGLYYVADNDSTTVLAIDVSTGQVARTIDIGQLSTVQDFEFKDGYAWGVSRTGEISRIDFVNGVIDTFPDVLPDADGGYGAAWLFGNGNLGFSANTSGLVTQLAITNSSSASPTFTVVSTVAGPSSSLNDGTAIPGVPADLAIDKTGPAVISGSGRITYELTVTNNGSGASSGWTVTDTLPSGLSNPEVVGDVSSEIDGNNVTVSGGRLEVGESVSFQIEADASVAAGACIDNTAQVLGNEEDPDESNNEDTATSCVLSLSLEKTSDATVNSRPGDVVTYTITATNTGEGDYTEDNPAVVLDDLSGVLDDADYRNDASASLPGTVSYASPLLSWTGALPTGASVQLTYTTTLKAGGDGEVRNVTWAPADPDNPEPPACDPPQDGADAVTGETCATTEDLLPKLTIEKSADRTELPAAGDVVNYTITVTNTGPGAYTVDAPATATDDLTDVLDAATYGNDATASTGTVTYNAPTLTWSGALDPGESVTITYSVTYAAEGDQNLRNLACVPVSETATGEPSCDFVQIPGAGLTQWKQVQSSDTAVVAGTVLTYTLFFANDGEAAADVDAVDDLSQVIDDADVTSEPTSPDGLTVTRNGDQISITGSVPAGATYRVTYQVTVKPDGERNDDIAANFLLGPNDNPPTSPDCSPTDDQFPDCTVTPIAVVHYSKAVVASDTPVVAGTVLTYTVTLVNTGTETTPVAREDVLTDVLDDADLTSGPTSDTASVTVSSVTGGRFQIGGELAAGATATITYQVTVKATADRGNNQADNFLVPPGGTPPETCADGSDQCTSTPMPQIIATKTSDPQSGTTVTAGQEITYTLTFTNSGLAAGTVDYSDDLSGVLDDAVLSAQPELGGDDAATTLELPATGILHVSGELASGQTVTVTYTVTVLPDGQRADNLLGNVLAPTGTTDPQCGDPEVSCTEHPVPELESWKGVVADSTPVAAGTVLTYTLYFENVGQAAASVDQIDDLTQVTDDADVTAEPSSDTGLAVLRDGNRISVTGEVAPGATATVSYQVTIRPDGQRNDDIMANYLLNPDEQPPAEPVCQPDDAEHPDCTVTPIGELLVYKSVSSSTDPVDTGTVLTYTLTFDNQGQGPSAVDYQDILTDVLDDSDLTSDPVASDQALSVSEVTDGAFTISGEVAAGQTVTVTYQVTVHDQTDRGNNSDVNFLVPRDAEPPTECVEGDQTCTVTPLPQIGVTKTANPATGSTVQAGQAITYTLTFTNTGEAAGPVDDTDNLTAVLDDADLTGTPASSDSALDATGGTDGLIRVTGTLEPDQTVTVSYTVTVKPDGQRGDDALRNVVAETGTANPQCGDPGVACTSHTVSAPHLITDPKTLLATTGARITGTALLAALLLLGGGLLVLIRRRTPQATTPHDDLP